MRPDKSILERGTLQARHFAEIGLSGRQLHVWCELTGFEPQERRAGTWREFSPADVFRLMTMKELKGRTGLAIIDHSSLVGFLGEEMTFFSALRIWLDGLEPVLQTDLDDLHQINPSRNISGSWLFERGPFWCLQSLAASLSLMMAATLRGGSDEQRAYVCEAVADRDHNAVLVQRRARKIDIPSQPFTEEKATETVQIWLREQT